MGSERYVSVPPLQVPVHTGNELTMVLRVHDYCTVPPSLSSFSTTSLRTGMAVSHRDQTARQVEKDKRFLASYFRYFRLLLNRRIPALRTATPLATTTLLASLASV